MKKSRDDQLNVYVNYYLEKRNYFFNHQNKVNNNNKSNNINNTCTTTTTNNIHKDRNRRKGLSLEEMVTNSIVDGCCPINPINGCLINGGDDGNFVELVHQSYSRLNHFVNESKVYRSILKSLLFPCWVKFFVQLMVNGHTEGAKSLLFKYESTFTEESQVNLIKCCHSALASNKLDSILLKYSSCKQSLLLPVDCHSYLLDFLHNLKDLNLLNECIPRYFDILTTYNSSLHLNDLKSSHHHLNYNNSSSSTTTTKAINHTITNNDNNNSPPRVNNLASNSVADALSREQSYSSSTGQEKENVEKAFEQLKRLPPCLPGSCVGYLEGCNPCTVDIRGDTKYFAAGFENSEINLWSLTAQGLKTQKSYSQPVSYNPLRIALSPDRINENLEEISPPRRSTALTGDKTLSGASILRGHSGPIYGLSFVQNSHYLISCSEDTTVRLWDLNSCKNTFAYTGHLYPVWSIDSSPLELYFVTGSRDTTARLWTFERLHPLRIFVGHLMDVDIVKFHPNASYIATGSSDKTIRFWDVNNGKMVRLFEGHKAGVISLAFSPDGKFLVSGSEDCIIKIWDLRATKGPLANISAHKGPVNDVSFNGDGSVLISGSSDRAVKFWDFKQIEEGMDGSKYLIHSITTEFSLIKLKMLPHNVIYVHGHKA